MQLGTRGAEPLPAAVDDGDGGDGNGATQLTVREEYTGPLLPMIWRSIPDLGPSFEQFVTGLKRRAEGA